MENEGFEAEWEIEAKGRHWRPNYCEEGPRRFSAKALHAGMLVRSAM